MFEPCSISRIIFVSVAASTFFATFMQIPGIVAFLNWIDLKDRSLWEEVIIPPWSIIWSISVVLCFVFNLLAYNCK